MSDYREVYTCIHCNHLLWEHGPQRECLFTPGTSYQSRHPQYPTPGELAAKIEEVARLDKQLRTTIEQLEAERAMLSAKVRALYALCCHVDDHGNSILEGNFIGTTCPRCDYSDY